jgi:uncharacterized protein
MDSSYESAFPLRAHHLLCILGFRGLGYSDAFVENMTKVVGKLGNDPEVMVTIIAEPDDICSACPHLTGDGCDGGGKSRDESLLTLLKMEEGDTMSLADAYARAAECLTPALMSASVCYGCEWVDHGYCAEGLAALKRCEV